ncbi:hypothetical protein DEMA109039_13715 [Deinococcus marmoris]
MHIWADWIDLKSFWTCVSQLPGVLPGNTATLPIM